MKPNGVLGKSWIVCLILMLWMPLQTLSASEEQDPLDLLWHEISSQIQPGEYYEGSLVRDAIWEIIMAADQAIVQAGNEAAEKAAAEAIRQIKPELEGWKARSQAAESKLRKALWITIGVGVGALLAGFLAGLAVP